MEPEEFEKRVNAVLSSLYGELHDFVVSASAKHGAGLGTKDRAAIRIYATAITSAMGFELGMIAAILGQEGPTKAMRAFRASFLRGVNEMRAEIKAAETPN